MAKPFPLIIGGIGLTGAAAGGVFLARGGASGQGNTQPSTSQTGSDVTVKQQKQEASQEEKFFETVEAFKNDAKYSSCVKGQFGELTIDTTGVEDISTGKPGSSSFFKGGEDTHTSCLIIYWKKTKEDSANKWKGKFTWLWTFKKGDEGFINFNIVEPASEENKIKFTGVFYLVGKKTQPNNDWEIKFQKEITSNTASGEKTELDKYLPKAKNAVEGQNNSKYWGFTEDANPAIKGDCTNENCTGITTKKPIFKKLHWTASSDSATQTLLKDWTEKWEWYEKIFGIKNHWNLEDKIKAFKGTWALQPQ